MKQKMTRAVTDGKIRGYRAIEKSRTFLSTTYILLETAFDQMCTEPATLKKYLKYFNSKKPISMLAWVMSELDKTSRLNSCPRSEKLKSGSIYFFLFLIYNFSRRLNWFLTKLVFV